mgnify:CR=1 FL=1
MIGFLRHALGALLLALGCALAGTYLAGEFSAHSWTGPSANPAIRFFQSSFFNLGGKPPESVTLLVGSGLLLLAGALLARMLAAVLAAGAFACLAVAGAAWVSFSLSSGASGGAFSLSALFASFPGLIDRDGRELGIVTGLGFSLLFLAVFTGVWGRWNAERKGRKTAQAASKSSNAKTSSRPAKPAPQEEDALEDPSDYDGDPPSGEEEPPKGRGKGNG